MTWSFHLKNGDLNFAGPGGFATVTGQQKLIQDIKDWLLEPRGTDPMHPDYGSTLNGGVMPDGTLVDSVVGQPITGETLLDIESEVRRVLAAYQQQQQSRLTDEAAKYAGKNTFSAGEILAQVLAVNLQQQADTVFVQIVLQTADGSQVSFVQPVATS